MISTKKYSKRVITVILALAMVFATTAVSFAAEGEQASPQGKTVTNYNVKIYKAGKNKLSMANAIIAPGTFATATTNEDGSVKIELPIVPIYNYTAMGIFTADGYLRAMTMKEAGQSAVISPNTTPYASAVMTINASSMPNDLKFKVSRSDIDLYKVNTDKPYPLMNHVHPAFDIVLTAM